MVQDGSSGPDSLGVRIGGIKGKTPKSQRFRGVFAEDGGAAIVPRDINVLEGCVFVWSSFGLLQCAANTKEPSSFGRGFRTTIEGTIAAEVPTHHISFGARILDMPPDVTGEE